ncbi:hypothetical protein A7M48_20505 [Acinetobacter baumannii]|nr:hypothetical protein A7M48_20505 [Acinetobacter baumannii]
MAMGGVMASKWTAALVGTLLVWWPARLLVLVALAGYSMGTSGSGRQSSEGRGFTRGAKKP